MKEKLVVVQRVQRGKGGELAWQRKIMKKLELYAPRESRGADGLYLGEGYGVKL